MLKFVFIAAVIHCGIGQQYQQKVAPGVPPQQYQGYQPPPPPQQNYQQQGYQQQQQFQQMPPQQVNQQQMPPPQMNQQNMAPPQMNQQQMPPPQMNQMNQQQMNQQQMNQQSRPHVQHDPQLLNPANIAQEREHIQEHMDVPIDTSKMSEQELQFHYFKMHDADNNNKLDGCELIKSLIHWHEQGHKQEGEQQQVGEKIFNDEELVNLIDPILKMDDHNRDGYIDYPEFVRAQQKSQQNNN